MRSGRGSAGRKRKPLLSITAISVFLLSYALGAALVGYESTDLFLLAWLMIAPLAIALYMARDAKRKLVNPYTLFFAALIIGTIAVQLFHHGK